MAGEEKTEKATGKKRQDERKKGNVPISRDVVILISLIGMFFCTKLVFSDIYLNFKQYLMGFIGMTASLEAVSNDAATDIAHNFMLIFVKICAILLVVSILLSVVTTAFQTKMLFSTESLKPKFDKLNPINGMKRMFSLRSLVEVVKGLIKITILFVIIYQYIEKRVIELPDLLTIDLISGCIYVLDTTFGLVMTVAIAFAAIAGLDYFYQRWDYERQMRMTKQEVKEEYKQMEGDPKVKGKIKQTQMKMAMSRMMQAVPTADVVIKNPTHFAVALKYDSEKNQAPVVVAKGQDELALRIIRIAEENDVYVMENKPLARAIYAATELNQEIPADYYGAIAEILVYVYKLKNKLQ